MALSNAWPKVREGGKTRSEERSERRSARESIRVNAYRAVDRRDGEHCRVCGGRCSTRALDLTLRAERHHIIPRSLRGPNESWNLLTVCKDCHDDRHVRGVLKLSGNADERNEMGRLAGVKVERLTESGWVFEGWV